jgi:glycosyltransferase involved in cell wall biosynthesis
MTSPSPAGGSPAKKWAAVPGNGPSLETAGLIARRRKVAVLSDALQDRNGVDAYYRDLVAHLRPHLEAIELLSPNPEDGDLASGLAVPLPGDTTQQIVFPHLPRLQRRLQRLRPDVVVSATNGPFGLAGIEAARRHGAALLAGFHTHMEGLCEMYWNPLVGGVTRRVMESQNRLLFRFARAVVVNSPHMERPARSLSATPVAVVGTPVDHRFLHTPTTPMGSELGRVLFAGRLAMEKNVLDVVASARRLPEIQFTIAGDGPLRDAIQTAAAERPNLTYAGHVPRSQMPALIDDHDLLVLPSALEAFGTIALEAMARQRLVLVSRHCGILSWPELSAGIYVLDDAEPLDAAIRRIAAVDAPLRERKARQARDAALALNQSAVGQWLELLSHDRR